MSELNLSRRRFLARSAAVGAGMALASYGCQQSKAPSSRVLGANEEIRVAVVGFHGRGSQLMGEIRKNQNVRIVALCDVDQQVLGRKADEFTKRQEKVDTYTDVRKVLDRNDIDAIVTATPNHWHALVTVWACQAGKDVYVEKPVCHEIWEGRQMVEAAKKYNRIVQAGTQRRSDTAFYEMVDYLRGGAMGKILHARALCYKERNSLGKVTAPTPIPASIDYDLWCGPAPKVPLMRKSLHYDWHWVWATGNGDIGNQGIHEVDQCRWVLGYNKLPTRVYSFGGRFAWKDDGETANTQFTMYDYPIPIIQETRGMRRKAGDTVMDNYKGVRIGIYIHCENGYYAGGENGGWVYDHKDNKVKQFVQSGSALHTNNFFAAMRSRKMSDLHAPITEGYLSSALCHMANISYRVGIQTAPSMLAETVKSNKLASDGWDRMRQHLAVNNIDLEKDLPVMGSTLQFDPDVERFVGPSAEKANALVRREYRAPFVVPAIV